MKFVWSDVRDERILDVISFSCVCAVCEDSEALGCASSDGTGGACSVSDEAVGSELRGAPEIFVWSATGSPRAVSKSGRGVCKGVSMKLLVAFMRRLIPVRRSCIWKSNPKPFVYGTEVNRAIINCITSSLVSARGYSVRPITGRVFVVI